MKPITCTDVEVRGILSGAKTQIRRVVKLPDAPNHLGHWEISTAGGFVDSRGQLVDEMPCVWHTRTGKVICCPYGRPGMKLWVRETFIPLTIGFAYRADGVWNAPPGDRWRSPILMPCTASRITFELTGVRVQRLQAISEADAVAEGCSTSGWMPSYSDPDNAAYLPSLSAVDDFAELWGSTNKRAPWASNPLVWALTFRRVDA